MSQPQLNYENDTKMMQEIFDYAKIADLGIEDIPFIFDSKEVNSLETMPEELMEALSQFIYFLILH